MNAPAGARGPRAGGYYERNIAWNPKKTGRFAHPYAVHGGF
jgi:hypothetical protein